MLSKLWRWIGLADKTLWDYLQLLIVPALLATLGVGLNEAANKRQHRDAKERYQQEVIREYCNVMAELLFEKDLRKKKSGDPMTDVAEAYTLNVLEALDGSHKRGLIRLLYKTNLIEGNIPIVSLQEGGALAKADLSGMYLWKVNLVGTDLRNADLQDASLSLAYLAGANLREANLRKARLWRANFRHADMEAADLSGANLIDADLYRTNLAGVILQNALYSKNTIFPQGFDPRTHGALFIGRNADLQGADLKRAFLRFVDLQNAILKGANLSQAQLYKADLKNADLTSANLKEAHLAEADLRGAQLTGANLREADFKGAVLSGADLKNAYFCNTIMPDGSINNDACPESAPRDK